MGTYEAAFIIGLVIFAMIMGLKYFYWSLHRDFTDMARLENDPEYREVVLSNISDKIAQTPQSADLYLQRSNIWRFDKKHDNIVKDLQQYLKLKPTDDSGWAELSDAFFALGFFNKSLLSIEKALDIDPEYPEWNFAAMRCCLALKKYQKARKHFDDWTKYLQKTLEKNHQNRHDLPSAEKIDTLHDHRVSLYRAALLCGEGRNKETLSILDRLWNHDKSFVISLVEEDCALNNLRDYCHR